jgi:hypothetical protein
MYLITMNSHILKKNLVRYQYYDDYLKFIDITSSSLPKLNKNRYLFFNKYFRYISKNSINVTPTIRKRTIPILDLSSNKVSINNNRINKYIDTGTQTDISSEDQQLPKFPLITNYTNSIHTNSFNVLDLLLPGLDHKPSVKNSLIELDKSHIPLTLEYTPEEKEYSFELLDGPIETIADLIKLGKQY